MEWGARNSSPAKMLFSCNTAKWMWTTGSAELVNIETKFMVDDKDDIPKASGMGSALQ